MQEQTKFAKRRRKRKAFRREGGPGAGVRCSFQEISGEAEEPSAEWLQTLAVTVGEGQHGSIRVPPAWRDKERGKRQ